MDGAVGTVRDLLFDDAELAVLAIHLTKGQVESSPEVDLPQPVSRQQFLDLNEHYGWPATWTDDPLLGTTYIGTRLQVRVEEEHREQQPERSGGDRHLRNASEVTGYRLLAQDGEVGHVEDLFADDQSWAIRYLLVDTRNWLAGREVTLATDWIERVGRTDGLVQVQVTREQVKDSPEYDPGPPPSRDYEPGLYQHYGFPGYWI